MNELYPALYSLNLEWLGLSSSLRLFMYLDRLDKSFLFNALAKELLVIFIPKPCTTSSKSSSGNNVVFLISHII